MMQIPTLGTDQIIRIDTGGLPPPPPPDEDRFRIMDAPTLETDTGNDQATDTGNGQASEGGRMAADMQATEEFEIAGFNGYLVLVVIAVILIFTWR